MSRRFLRTWLKALIILEGLYAFAVAAFALEFVWIAFSAIGWVAALVALSYMAAGRA